MPNDEKGPLWIAGMSVTSTVPCINHAKRTGFLAAEPRFAIVVPARVLSAVAFLLLLVEIEDRMLRGAVMTRAYLYSQAIKRR